MTQDEHDPLSFDLDYYVGELKHDEAAVRSVRRKYEELQERVLLGEISVDTASDELHSEFDACLPSDETA